MAIENPPIQAIQNADGSYNLKLNWGWHEASDIAHGWILYIKQTDADTYATPLDWDDATKVKLSAQSLSHTLFGVNPTNRFSFAIQAFFNASDGMATGSVVSYQTEAIWDGQGLTPLPNLLDWIDVQASAWVDLMAPITSADLFLEGTDAEGDYIIVDLTVDDRNDEGTETQVRAGRDFGTWHTIVPANGMIVLNSFDNSASYVTAPGGTNLPVKIYRKSADVILQYRSQGVETGRVENIKEFIADQNQLPSIVRRYTTNNFTNDADKKLLWWWGDDDVEYVKLYLLTNLLVGSETPVQNPADSTLIFPAQGNYEVDLPVPGEKIYRIEPWGRNITSQQAVELSVRETVRREVTNFDVLHELSLTFANIDVSDQHELILTISVVSFTDGVPIEGANVKYTTTPEVSESWLTLVTDSEGLVDTPALQRPAPGFGDIIYYFQAEYNGKISPVKEFQLDEDDIPELHHMSFTYDGAIALIFEATCDDDVGGVKLEFSPLPFDHPDFDPDTVVEPPHLQNTSGELRYTHNCAPGETWYLKATAYEGFSGGAVDGVQGASYFARATRLGGVSTEIYDLQRVSQTSTDATFEFYVGEHVVQVNTWWEDNQFPDDSVFDPGSNPQHSKIVITQSPAFVSGPYQYVLPLPDPGIERHFYMEALDGQGFVTDAERGVLKVEVGIPPAVTLRTTITDGVLKLEANVRSVHESYPVTLALSEWNGTSYTAITPLDKSSFALADAGSYFQIKNNISLPFDNQSKRFRVTVTDTEGLVSQQDFDVDRNNKPEARVDKVDGKANPKISIDYDDDVLYVKLTTPGAKVKTWTPLDGDWGGTGGVVEYTVGVTAFDDSSIESAFSSGQVRGRYKVEIGDGVQTPIVADYVTLQGPPAFNGGIILDQDTDLTVDLLFTPPDGALSVKYAVSTTAFPDDTAVNAETEVTIPPIVINDIHTYTAGTAGKVYVSAKFFFTSDASDAGTALVFARDSYSPGSGNLRLSIGKYNTGSTTTEGFELTAVTSSDEAAIYYRVYDEGTTSLPAFTRSPSTPGTFAPDPYTIQVAVTLPTSEDAPDKILEVYAVDDLDGQTSPVVIPIDRGIEPNIQSISIVRNPDSSVTANWRMDSDSASIRIATSQSSMPAIPGTSSGTAYNGVASSATILATSDPKLPVYWAASPCSATGGTGTAGVGQQGVISVTPQAPSVQVKTSQTLILGTLTLTINDPSGFVNATSFMTKSLGGVADFSTDPSTWAGYDNVAPYNLTQTVIMGFRHNSYIGWAVRYNDGTGNKWIQGVETFDLNVIPRLSAALHLRGDQVYLSYTGDEDLQSIRYAVSAVGPPDSAAVAAGTVVAGQSNQGTLVQSGVAFGTTIYVRVRGFSAADGTGVASSVDFEAAVKRTADQLVPTVQAKSSQSGTTGTVTLTLEDPANRVVETAFKVQQGFGNYDFTNPADGTWNRDTTSPYTLTQNVGLIEKHVSFIGWAVGYTNESGTTKYITGFYTFDFNAIPEFACGLHIVGSDVFLSWAGDEDLGSVRYATSTSAMPSTTDVAAGTISTGRNVAGVQIATGLAELATLYVRVRGYTATNGTGTASNIDWMERVQRPKDTIIPNVEAKTSQSGALGTLSLTINDPKGYVNATAFEAMSGGGAFDFTTNPSTWDVFDTVAAFQTSHTVALTEKHTSFIGWGVRYNDGSGDKWIKGIESFDIDEIPQVACGVHQVAGNVFLSWNGDEDLASIGYVTSTSSMPANMTGQTTVNGRSNDGLNIGSLSESQVLYIRVRGYSGLAGAGNPTPVDWTERVERPKDTVVPTIEAKPSQSGTTGSLALIINDSKGYVNATSFQTAAGGGNYDFTTDPATWAGFDSISPFNTSQNVTLTEKHPSFIGWAVRYNDGSGNKWVRGVQVFDFNEVPDIACGVHVVGSNVYLSYTGDEDTGSVRYAVSTSAMPTSGDVAAGTIIAGRTNEGTVVYSTLTETQVLYLRVRGFSASNGTGTASAADWTERVQRPKDTIIPTVEAKPSQSGITGTLTLLLNDPKGYVTATAFENKSGGGNFDFTSDPSTWDIYDTTAPFTLSHTVGITAKHPSMIAWAVRYDAQDGAGAKWIKGVEYYDFDEIPNFAAALQQTAGNVILSWSGDEDVGSIGYVTSTSSMPANMTGQTTVNGRSNDGITIGTVAENQTMYVRVRAYSGATGAGKQSETDWTDRVERQKDTIIPTVRTQINHSATTGQVSLVLNDPKGYVNATSFEYRSGDTAGAANFATDPALWSGYDNVAPFALISSTSLLGEKHNTYIAWAVRYNSGAGDVWIQGVETFDLNQTASVSGNASLNGSNQAVFEFVGDDDTTSIKYLTSTSSYPSEASVQSSGTVVSGRSGSVNTGVVPTGTQTVFITVVPYNGSTPGPGAQLSPGGSVPADGTVIEAKIANSAVSSRTLIDGAVIANKMDQAAQKADFSGDFTGTNQTSISWTAGTMVFADTSTASINAGSLSSMAASTVYYIYYNRTISTTTLQTTTTQLTATDEPAVLVATAMRASSSSENAWAIKVIGAGIYINSLLLGNNAVTETKITNDAISSPKIQANAVGATQIAANAIVAGKIAANAISAGNIQAGSISTTHISSITANVINFTAQNITAGRFTSTNDSNIYIDLEHTSSQPFINHPGLTLLANGTATFSGTLSAASGTFAGNLQTDTLTFMSSGGTTRGSWAMSFGLTLRDANGSDKLSVVTDSNLGLVAWTGLQVVGGTLKINPDEGLQSDVWLKLKVPTSGSAGSISGYIKVYINGVGERRIPYYNT